MRQKLYIVVCLLFIFISNIAYSECDFTQSEKHLSGYLEQLSKRKMLVFFASSKTKKREIFLILEIDNPNGMLIEKEECSIVNLGTVSYSDIHHTFVIEETHGGVSSYERVGNLLRNVLLKQKFILIKPDEIRKLLNIRHRSDDSE